MKSIKTIIADYIFNKLSADMGNWFDHIQTNEEEVYNEILHILENGTIADKIKLLKGGVL